MKILIRIWIFILSPLIWLMAVGALLAVRLAKVLSFKRS